MVPAAFVALAQLPLTPNGKVDRAALPAPETAPSVREYVAPRNEIEEVIAEVWSELLHVGRISVHDNFFDLGGHSLLMTQSASKLREMFQVPLSLKNVFSASTIEQLADLVLEKLVEQEDAEDLEELLVEVQSVTDRGIGGGGAHSRPSGVKGEEHG
jgi:acyl carrier protein